VLVKILGSAAGGGFPQWNCACANCSALRAGTFRGRARSQTQVAVSEDGDSWFLLGASPDLRTQIEATASLHPQSNSRNGVRHSPIKGVVLQSADLDHVLGLLLLRELQPLNVYATAPVSRILRERNSMFGMLNRVPDQIAWHSIVPGAEFELMAGGRPSGLRCEALGLSNRYPSYAKESQGGSSTPEAVVGLLISSASGKTLAFFPAVEQWDNALLERLRSADVVLIDGTFWSDDELIRVQGSGQTAREMGHLPVGAPGGMLDCFNDVKRPRKIFVHINNTNPMLDEGSPEHRAVVAAGWQIAEDGWEFEI
jgi:pyrroloquinoline quinone biosynthesis protein B